MSEISTVHLSKNALMEEAEKQTGLRDWGARLFEAGLDVLLASIDQEAQLNDNGRLGVRAGALRILSNRLKLEADDYRSLPSDERPTIFILGPARSGTTLLQRLLSLDPQAGFLRYADSQYPVPATVMGSVEDGEKLQRCSELTRIMYQRVPTMVQIHEMQPDFPDEEIWLLEQLYITVLFPLRMYVPTYTQWYLTTDLQHEAYRELRRLTTYIGQHRSFHHWVFKTPQHLFALDALLNNYPAAKLIWMHRDPVKTMSSFSSMSWRVHRVNSDQATPFQASEQIVNLMQIGVERAMAVRKQVGDARFCDVYYRDLMADPVAEVQRIYAQLAMPFSPQMETAMREWLTANPQDKYGRHSYTLEEFGLSAEALTSRFSAYIDYFQIPREG